MSLAAVCSAAVIYGLAALQRLWFCAVQQSIASSPISLQCNLLLGKSTARPQPLLSDSPVAFLNFRNSHLRIWEFTFSFAALVPEISLSPGVTRSCDVPRMLLRASKPELSRAAPAHRQFFMTLCCSTHCCLFVCTVQLRKKQNIPKAMWL